MPALAPGEARLAVLAVGICGSDLHVFHEGTLGAAAAAYPFVMGHEAVGRVEAVHDAADEWLVGRRVSIEPTISCGACALCQSGSPNLCLDQRFLSLPPHLGLLRERVTHPGAPPRAGARRADRRRGHRARAAGRRPERPRSPPRAAGRVDRGARLRRARAHRRHPRAGGRARTDRRDRSAAAPPAGGARCRRHPRRRSGGGRGGGRRAPARRLAWTT